MAENTDRDAIYARVSSGRQERERTIDAQLHAVHQRFDVEGRPLYRVYADDPFTGTVPHRPALDACLRDAQAGHFNRLLVYSPDRMARGKAWMRSWLEGQFSEYGVRVEYATYKAENTRMGRFMDTVQDGFSEAHREYILETTANGLASKEARGSFHWARAPYGWRYTPQQAGKKDGAIEIVPSEAAIVREMFTLVLAGKSCYAVADILDGRGLRTRAGKKFTGKSVASVMHNLVHSGRLVKGRYKGAIPDRPREHYNAERKTSIHQQDRSAWRIHELPHRIVTPEEQDAAIARLPLNQKRSTRNAKHPFLLSGLVRCGHDLEGQPGQSCGRMMTGSARANGQRYYQCSRSRSTDATVSVSCKGLAKADVLEAAVWARLAEVLSDPQQLVLRAIVDMGDNLKHRSDLTKRLASAGDGIESYQIKLDALLDLRLAGDVDKATYERKEAELVAARDNAAAEIEHLREELSLSEKRHISLEGIPGYCEQVRSDLATLTSADDGTARAIKQRHLRNMTDAVWVYPDGRVVLKGVLPMQRPDWLPNEPIPPFDDIVLQSPWSSSHNPIRFSLVIAA